MVVNYDENAENFVEHDSSDNKSDSENSVLSDFNSTLLDKTNRWVNMYKNMNSKYICHLLFKNQNFPTLQNKIISNKDRN